MVCSYIYYVCLFCNLIGSPPPPPQNFVYWFWFWVKKCYCFEVIWLILQIIFLYTYNDWQLYVIHPDCCLVQKLYTHTHTYVCGFLCGKTVQIGPRLPRCLGCRSHNIRYTHTHTHIWYEFSEWVISSLQRPVPTQHNTIDKHPCPERDSHVIPAKI